MSLCREILQQPFAQSAYLRLNFVIFDSAEQWLANVAVRNGKMKDVPFFLQLQLEFKTLYLHLALFLMLEDALIRFSVLWRCFSPYTRTIRRRFMDA